MSTISRSISRKMARRQNLQVWRLLPADVALVEDADTLDGGVHVQLTTCVYTGTEADDTISAILHFAKWEGALTATEENDVLYWCLARISSAAINLGQAALVEAADTVSTGATIT